ncbi:ABC transporter ATP-binding protein [Paenibacillus sp. P25]|nr:ABC transporter ATP-binding protein [Paenibacillus sp. P25]
MDDVLLRISNLTTEFQTDKGAFPAVSGVDLTVHKGEVLCIVGESGSGKTVASLSLMQLLPSGGKMTSGEIWFEGRDLLKAKKKEMSKIRGKSISMIFQDPMVALDPVYPCGHQIMEAMRVHEKVSSSDAYEKTVGPLKHVGIAHPERVMNAYPHELSGGMCQRIMIAMALSCGPKLADRRRADDGARCDRAGANSGTAQGHTQGAEYEHPADHARPRRCRRDGRPHRRDVCRQGHGRRRRPIDFQKAPASLYPRADPFDSPSGPNG